MKKVSYGTLILPLILFASTTQCGWVGETLEFAAQKTCYATCNTIYKNPVESSVISMFAVLSYKTNRLTPKQKMIVWGGLILLIRAFAGKNDTSERLERVETKVDSLITDVREINGKIDTLTASTNRVDQTTQGTQEQVKGLRERLSKLQINFTAEVEQLKKEVANGNEATRKKLESLEQELRALSDKLNTQFATLQVNNTLLQASINTALERLDQLLKK